MLGVVVAIDELLMSVVASAVAGVAVTVVVSVAIWGVARYVDYHDDGRQGAAIAALLTGILGLILTAAIIISGIALMVAG
ncbi:MAG: hypothetical protein M9938_07910 [Solirubrobacterales bacterium]|nr:hypothetical protein [Solirubrobacterales bacterium]